MLAFFSAVHQILSYNSRLKTAIEKHLKNLYHSRKKNIEARYYPTALVQ